MVIRTQDVAFYNLFVTRQTVFFFFSNFMREKIREAGDAMTIYCT